jgi:alkylation response protein AidB-like acyl-CoA dehydrogenase
VSAAAACALGAREDAQPLTMTGLRGARDVEQSERGHLVLAAVALGIGTAATGAALDELRRSKATPGEDVEKPHWVIADVATDLEAARLLTYKAARSGAAADVGLARLMASSAAARAVDAALRVIGPAALAEGHLIERLARDVRALSVLAGTEEDQRAMAAEGLLPR